MTPDDALAQALTEAPTDPSVRAALEALRPLSESAWPGPWWTHHAPDHAYEGDWPIVAAPDTFLVSPGVMREADARFIVAAVNHIRAALAATDGPAAEVDAPGAVEALTQGLHRWLGRHGGPHSKVGRYRDCLHSDGDSEGGRYLAARLGAYLADAQPARSAGEWVADAVRERHYSVPYHWTGSGERGDVCAASLTGLHHRVTRWPCEVESAIAAALAAPPAPERETCALCGKAEGDNPDHAAAVAKTGAPYEGHVFRVHRPPAQPSPPAPDREWGRLGDYIHPGHQTGPANGKRIPTPAAEHSARASVGQIDADLVDQEFEARFETASDGGEM